VGLLGVILFLDEKDEIRYMLAPDLQYNRTKGVFPTFRLFGYPTPLRRYSILIGKSTTKDEDYELEFSDRGYWEGRAFILASFVHERDSTDRFFGFGNDSRSTPHRDPERALAYVEMADRRLGSSTSFVKFGAEWRDFIPLRQGNPILALHALANYTSGDLKTPFWEQSSLGGRRTLRGFGSDRFIDFNRSL